MAQLAVRRIAYALGAEVTGVDLRGDLDAATIEQIRQAWNEHLLLCFPNQDMDTEQLMAFAARFGELEPIPEKRRNRALGEHATLITEQPVGGKAWDYYKSGSNWHTDKSYIPAPTMANFLCAKVIPPVGGDTMFANMYLAYETLSPVMQRIVEGLWAIHDRAFGQFANEGRMLHLSKEDRALLVEGAKKVAVGERLAAQPVVRIHPETKRKALYFGDRVRQFVGVTEEESRPLCEFLVAHATRYEFTYRHRWSLHDTVMWDNRCLMHIALSDYDVVREPRSMLTVRLQGEKSGYVYENGATAAPAEPAMAAR